MRSYKLFSNDIKLFYVRISTDNETYFIVIHSANIVFIISDYFIKILENLQFSLLIEYNLLPH